LADHVAVLDLPWIPADFPIVKALLRSISPQSVTSPGRLGS
jgi:hypothetical protein